MRNIVAILPNDPAWYARWRLTRERTRIHPVTVSALVEDDGSHRRNVVGVDAGGQRPGGYENEPGWDCLRYVYEPLDAGQPGRPLQPDQESDGVGPP
jgi:hypothetical protein